MLLLSLRLLLGSCPLDLLDKRQRYELSGQYPQTLITEAIRQFDDINPTVPGATLEPPNGDGTYQGVSYLGWSLVARELPVEPVEKNLPPGTSPPTVSLPVGHPGIFPNSGTHAISFGTTGFETIQAGEAAMTADYPDSPAQLKLVSLYNFYYGCSSGGDQSLAAAPLSCQISVTCQNADGSHQQPQTFDFKVNTEQTYAYMAPATVTGFTDCYKVVFGVHSTVAGVSGVADSAVSAFIDTVVYSVR